MKAMKYLCMLLLMVAMNVSFVSCSDGGDEEPTVEEQGGLVGSWSQSGDRWTVSFRFGKDGTGSMTEIETTQDGHSQTTNLQFEYVYTENSNLLKLYVKGSDVVYNYTVGLTGSTLMLTSGTTTYVLTRQ